MLGWAIFQACPGAAGYCSPSTRIPEGSGLLPLDQTDARAVRGMLEERQPEVVIHCGAICKVEKCELHPEFARLINVAGTANLLRWLAPECRLLYCSSDHVFSGDNGPCDEHTQPDPLTVYGRTRVEAERLVLTRRPDALVVRSPLCVGPSYNGRSGHLDWLRYRQQKGLPMTVVADEHRSALWTSDAADRVLKLAASSLSGLRHLVSTRTVSRPELARFLVRRFGLQAQFAIKTRAQRRVPHLGRVELCTAHDDALASPLPSVLDVAEKSLAGKSV